MRELNHKEIQWLEAFTKKHEFFASFLLHYKLSNHLSNNQYYWLRLFINQAEENDDTLLTAEEVIFLEEKSQNDESLRELIEIYKDKGYLENLKYKKFLSLKTEMMGEIGKVKPTAKDKVVSMFLSGNKENILDNYKKTISDFGHYNFFFAFKRHLVQQDVLNQESRTFYKKTEEFDVENDYWILRKDILI